MVEQRGHGVADQVRRGLVAGDEQQHHELDDLADRERAFSPSCSRDDHAHEVVGRAGAGAPRRSCAGSGISSMIASMSAASKGSRAAGPGRMSDDRVGPALEVLPPRRLDAEHLGDDRARAAGSRGPRPGRRARRERSFAMHSATSSRARASQAAMRRGVKPRFTMRAHRGVPLAVLGDQVAGGRELERIRAAPSRRSARRSAASARRAAAGPRAPGSSGT